MIVGGISKSAIIPFQFWLPGAMAAPTPASAYLHAATMVKAGIYLFARLAPAFAVLPLWQPLLMTLGGATMLFGAVIALRQRDLKLLLAYGTVSQLGLMTLLIGCGNPDALLGGLAMLIAHATFKAPLFFVVGIIDTSTGTRDLTKLSGPAQEHAGGRRDGRAGRDQHGRDPADARLRGQGGRVRRAAGRRHRRRDRHRGDGRRFGVHRRLQRPVPLGRVRRQAGRAAPRRRQPTSAWMTGPTMLLVVLGLVLGVFPALLEPLLQSYAQTAGPTHEGAMALWHGLELPLALSAAGWLVGAGIFAAQRARERRTEIARAGRRGRRRLPGHRQGRRRARRRRHRGHPARLAAGVARRDSAGADRVSRHHADPGGDRPDGRAGAGRAGRADPVAGDPGPRGRLHPGRSAG